MNNYMEIACNEAFKAYKKNEVPVGAVIVKDNKIIAKAHNNRQNRHTVLGHAEINAILKAEKKLFDWRLDDCELYVTLMPCTMCQEVIKQSRINKVYYLIDAKNVESEEKYTQTKVCSEIFKKYNNIFNKFFNNLRK